MIKIISNETFSLRDGKDKLIEAISTRLNSYDTIEKLGMKTGLERELPVLPLIESSAVETEAAGEEVDSDSDLTGVEDYSEKRLSREFRDDLFPQRVSVTTTTMY